MTDATSTISIYSQINFPFESTLAFMPPLAAFFPPPEANCSIIFVRSNSLLCFARVASLSDSAEAFAAFWASRLAAF